MAEPMSNYFLHNSTLYEAFCRKTNFAHYGQSRHAIQSIGESKKIRTAFRRALFGQLKSVYRKECDMYMRSSDMI